VIRVVVGELGREAVDAVVRPADATPRAGWCAPVRLDELGGDGFRAGAAHATPLEAGAAVVTGAGALAAGFVLPRGGGGRAGCGPAGAGPARAGVRLQRAGDWGLARVAAPLVGTANGQLTVEVSAELLVETFPGPEGRREPPELRIVVDAPAERDVVEAIVRRKT